MISRAMKLFICNFVLLVCVSTSFADWSSQSLLWAKRFDQGPVSFSNPYVIEAWSAAQAEEVRDAHIHIESVPSTKFGSGKFSVALQTKRTASLAVLKAPLILFLPGLFDEKDSHGSMRTAAFYSERGFHVVIPSNPWSKDYIQDDPHFNPGTLEQEAGVALDALDYAITRIGKENITHVYIAGESYGALQASIAFSKDHQRTQPLIDGTATFYSPPLDITTAIENLDHGTDQTQDYWEAECASIKDVLDDYNSLTVDSAQSKMPAELDRCAGPLVYNTFHESLVESIELLHKIKKLGVIPTEKGALTKWKHDLRFKDVIREFTPENGNILEEGKGTLSYWVQRLPSDAQAHVQIISAQDDPLNQNMNWNLGGGVFTPENTIILPWGGHMGYENLPVFQKLLNIAF